MMASPLLFFAMAGQQIALRLPSFPYPSGRRGRRTARKKSMSPNRVRCGLAVLAVTVALGGSVALAQNLDQGKPATKLFAESCATCHRSPRGLAKGRFHLTLYLFLQKHYSSNSSSAWALTSYLESVDSGKRPAAKSSAKTGASRTRLLRPPAPVPSR
jgi:hypothetical protein